MVMVSVSGKILDIPISQQIWDSLGGCNKLQKRFKTLAGSINSFNWG